MRFRLKDFPNRLHAWFEYLGWALRNLERASDVKRGIIWKWRAGKVGASMTVADRVLEAMRVPAGEFFEATPDERVRLCIEAVAMRAGDERPTLHGIQGLRRGDFLAAMNAVPLSAVPVMVPGTDILGFLEGEGLQALVGLPLFDAGAYPSQKDRLRTVAFRLSGIAAKLRNWRFAEEEVEMAERAWREIDAMVSEGGPPA